MPLGGNCATKPILNSFTSDKSTSNFSQIFESGTSCQAALGKARQLLGSINAMVGPDGAHYSVNVMQAMQTRYERFTRERFGWYPLPSAYGVAQQSITAAVNVLPYMKEQILHAVQGIRTSY